MQPISGIAAGVPYVAVPPGAPAAVPPDAPPAGDAADAPIVVAWHLLDAPRTETAFAAALPLDGLPAWRIYLGLPMTGRRTPPGGEEEVLRLLGDDIVANVHGPIVTQAVAEFPDAFAVLRKELGLGAGPVGLLGGSLGAAVAQTVLLDHGTGGAVDVSAAVLVSPLVRLRPVIDAIVQMFTGKPYQWTADTDAFAERMDFAGRAAEFVERGRPPVLLVLGAQDEPWFRQPVEDLHSALAARYEDPGTVALHVVDGMGHALADEPGLEPAPQTVHAAEVDRMAVDWFRRYLVGARR
jgi:dienelactone hydrolase